MQIAKLFSLTLGFLFSYCASVFCQTGTKTTDTPGEKLVTIGYHKLFIREGGPKNARYTVIFESGAGGGANDWTKVISLLPADIRTIAYDRAGTGKSDQGPLPRTLTQEVFELHQLLKILKITGPVVLVGQSMGGLLVRLYTDEYGKNVVGVVLVDPACENGMLGSFKYGGWVRLREKAIGKPIPNPQLENTISVGYDSTADYMAEEFQKIYLSAIKNPRQLKDRPLIILGAGKRNQPPGTPDEQWKEIRAERDKQVEDFTILSSNSKFILDPLSGHNIHKDNPEIVAKSIQEVIHSIVSKTKF